MTDGIRTVLVQLHGECVAMARACFCRSDTYLATHGRRWAERTSEIEDALRGAGDIATADGLVRASAEVRAMVAQAAWPHPHGESA